MGIVIGQDETYVRRFLPPPMLLRTAPALTTWAYGGGRSSSSPSPDAAASQSKPSSASPGPGFPPPAEQVLVEPANPMSEPPPPPNRSSRALWRFFSGIDSRTCKEIKRHEEKQAHQDIGTGCMKLNRFKAIHWK